MFEFGVILFHHELRQLFGAQPHQAVDDLVMVFDARTLKSQFQNRKFMAWQLLV
jgi:hypothetical protein